MALAVDVLVDPASGERPPPGSRVHVEVRDTSVADAPARVTAQADGDVREGGGALATLELPDADLGPGLTVWAHVDVERTGRVSAGDYVTMQSYPLPSPELSPARLAVTVRPVR
jgi:uncharacterized lipoprotein YbaY